MNKDEMTWERVMVSALIGAVIGVVALLANYHIPKALNGRKE
jgi:RsiW-degrading membrane proteinase PrsW (M82 family)